MLFSVSMVGRGEREGIRRTVRRRTFKVGASCHFIIDSDSDPQPDTSSAPGYLISYRSLRIDLY
jgi:hypothetical protein